jgi:arabinogalactan oligomer / maltooligosaccharide transport system permease protein
MSETGASVGGAGDAQVLTPEVLAASRAAPKRKRRMGKRSWYSSLALHAWLLIAVAIAIFPVFWILISSFKPQQEISGSVELDVWPNDWTWSNYKNVITNNDYEFLHWFWNSIAIALVTTIVGVFLAATAGYALSRYRFPGYRPALNSFLVTQMFPAAILLVPIFQIIVTLGLLNTKLALILTYSTVAVPFCTWMLKGYFDTIPISLDEAGRIDGLTPFGVFWRIVMPLSLPGIAVTAFYSFITAWNEVAFANVILTENSTYTLPVGLQTYVFQFDQDWELLTAGAMLVTVPAVLLFLFAQRYLVSGLTRGGVKG